MPIGSLVRVGQDQRLRPLLDYLAGPDLGALLAKNRYPPTTAGLGLDAFPAGARLQWPGWDYVRSHDIGERSREAARLFFAVRSF